MSESPPQPPQIGGSQARHNRGADSPSSAVAGGAHALPEVSGLGRRARAMFRFVLGAILAAVAAWFLLKEAIEPHWTIRLGELLWPGPPPSALELGGGLAVRAYADTRPHVGKITPLQKGLVLLQDGRELIEEGYGFGTPIVLQDGRSYLSQHTEVAVSPDGREIVKRFTVDVEDTWTRPFRRKYRAVAPLGSVVFTYTVAAPGILDVAVDFTGLRATPDLVYLANEQGARAFTLYSDSSGLRRYFADVPDTPDQWVATTAERTCFTAEARKLRFCVETQPGQAKYVGRERYYQRRWSGLFSLSWAGTDLELTRPQGVYRYRVSVEALP